MSSHVLQLQNGVQSIIPPVVDGAKYLISFKTKTLPSAGTIKLEYRNAGRINYFDAGTRQFSDSNFEVYGTVEQYRITIDGLVGGSGLAMSVLRIDAAGFPDGAFEGLRALTVQSYTEANVKNGVQYETSNLELAVAPAGTINVIMQTGDLPVVVKGRFIEFDGDFMTADVYENPVFTGGTPLAYFNLNMINPVVGGVTLLTAPTITDNGIKIAATTYGIGVSAQGNKFSSTFRQVGNERILAPNTDYLLRITNTSASAQDFATYIAWYEGGLDLPLN